MQTRITMLGLFFIASIFPTPLFASNGMSNCSWIVTKELSKIENLENKLPSVPDKDNESFLALYQAKGLPGFYELRQEPHYYLWLLRNDITAVKNTISTYVDEEDEPLSNMFMIGEISFSFSNLRNSWTEYAAYSKSSPFTDQQKNQISSDMSQLSMALNVYTGCLAAKIVNKSNK